MLMQCRAAVHEELHDNQQQVTDAQLSLN